MQFDPTLSLSVLLSTVVTIAGFVINRFISRKEAESAEKQRNKELKNTHEQIKALQEQADALKLQVTLAARREAIPRWALKNIKGGTYAVCNLNSYRAESVKVISSSDQTYPLGDIRSGGQMTFDLIESYLMNPCDSVEVKWFDPEEEKERSLELAVPPKQRYR